MVVLVLVMGYIAMLFRRPWVENERLSYPIIQLPLEITNPKTPILKNRLLFENNISGFFTSKPWSAIGGLHVGVVPSVIGLAFFMPLDMSFSWAVFFS